MSPNRLKNARVALVHDFITQEGGAERILVAFAEMFPAADIFTIVSDLKITNRLFPGHKIFNSFIQKLPLSPKYYKLYLALMPKAIETFNFNKYDLVISDSSAFAKGIITAKSTKHICYLHTPTRYLWGETDYYLKTAVPIIIQPLVKLILPYLKKWDYEASKRPDIIIANSRTIEQRTQKYYHRKSDYIIPPFVENDKFFQIPKIPQKYYLLAGRIVPYKRYDIVIRAFNQLRLPLYIIGQGYGLNNLIKINNSSNTKFLGRVSDEKLSQYYQQCLAYIFPAEEDFGITPLEAMVSGRPVIAYRRGGSTETIINKKTGIFFNDQTPESLISAIKQFKSISFDSKFIQKYALQFSKSCFTKEIEAVLKKEF